MYPPPVWAHTLDVRSIYETVISWIVVNKRIRCTRSMRVFVSDGGRRVAPGVFVGSADADTCMVREHGAFG